jgi:branched-chain amino acid transport system ATP-binding protein
MLNVADLRVSYGKIEILHGVSFAIEEGKIVTFVGGNGAGKSTLINTISGLIRPTDGQIIFNGGNLGTLPPYEIVKAGVVQIPEGRKLFPQMTVYDNLMVGGANPRVRQNRPRVLEEMYRDFPILRERANQLAGTLSGGEQQMLAIARGLMSQPKLLMLDEPSLGLAPMIVREIFHIVTSLNQKGLTIFLVEQNIKHSLMVCHYGYVLQNGAIVLQGNGQDLLTNDFTRKAYLGL